MITLDLQRFAEEVTSSGAGASPSPQGEGFSGDVTGGIGTSPHPSASPTPSPQKEGSQQPTFDELIQGQYRQEYEQSVGRRIQSAIQDRFKNQQNYRQAAEAAQPIMAALGHKFGLSPTDVAGITAKLNEDAYAEEANSRGVPVDVVRNEHQLKDQVARQEKQLQQVRQEQQFRQHFATLSQQAQEFAKEFPGFDLMAEVRSNPDFAKWTSPEYGMSVRQAYYASHGPQMQAQGMQYAAQQAGKSIAASVAAGASRPMENGMQRPGAAQMGTSIAGMSPEQRRAIREQLSMGRPVKI